MLMITKAKPLNKPGIAFFDIRRLFKYWPEAVLYIIYGAGGYGKTTTCVKFLAGYYRKQIEEIKNKSWSKLDLLNGQIQIQDKFVWLNRTDTEIKSKGNGLFGANGWFVHGNNNEVVVSVELDLVDEKSKKKQIYNIAVGKFEALNNSSKIRGGESYEEYKFIIWDEFMDEVDKYSSDEETKISSIMTTVMRNKTGKMKLLFLSNTVSKYNSVFEMFKFNATWIQKNQQLYIPQKKTLFCYAAPNYELKQNYEKSDLMTILGEDNKYLKYRFGAEFVNDNDLFVLSDLDPTIQLKPMYNFILNGDVYGVFGYGDCFYIDRHHVVTHGRKYFLTKADAIENGTPYRNVEGMIGLVYNKIKTGKILFNGGVTKNVFLDFIAKKHKFKPTLPLNKKR